MIFGTLPGGAPVELFELSSDKLTVRISNYGGRIISVVKDGMDMIVGPKRFEDMLKDTCYCGAASRGSTAKSGRCRKPGAVRWC